MTPTVPRFEELAAPSHWRTVDFISDLHLQTAEPATVAAWQHYLQTTPADALFILGDLFEVWVGDDSIDEPGSFEAHACAALRTTAQFFINVADNGFLNHTAPSAQGWGYAVFGKVVSGADVVDKIKAVKTGRSGFHDDVPKEDVVIEKAVAL